MEVSDGELSWQDWDVCFSLTLSGGCRGLRVKHVGDEKIAVKVRTYTVMTGIGA